MESTELALRLPQLCQTIERASVYDEDDSDSGNSRKKTIVDTNSLNHLSLEKEFATFIQFIDKAIDVEDFYVSGVWGKPAYIEGINEIAPILWKKSIGKLNITFRIDLPGSLPKGMSSSDVKHDLPGKHHDGHSFRVGKSLKNTPKDQRLP